MAAQAALDAPVPGCPGWDVEALLRHVGDVHRWAATIVRDKVHGRLRRDFAGPADRAGLLVWYADGLKVERGTPGGDCALRAPATTVFALLMNRHDGTGVSVEGDRDILRAWREHVRF